jgi:hypothetical protein
MSLTVPIRDVNHASPSSRAESAGIGRRSTPPAAIKLLLPVWGYGFVRQFLDAGLPTLLAPGNLPALASTLPCEFVILTSEDDEPFIRLHPTFRALSDICTTEIRLIDHLITGTNYSTTLTLAFTEAVRVTGPAMLDTCFFFLGSDYIMADGSLGYVMARMMNGASGVLVGNFQVAVESAFPWLQTKLSRATPALALSPRELMPWGLAHLHPTTIANTVNFPLNHNRHTNRLFWRVDGQTLIGRFYLMHPIAVRPETMDFVIGASVDYSFIPEMCPSGNIEVITDSDEYLVVEMQSHDHEVGFLRPGRLRPRALARTLSEWTTQHHRQNVRHSIIFHAGDLPKTLDAMIAAADRFIAAAERSMRRKPKPYRDHPYWRGALVSQHEATGKPLDMLEQWLALGLPNGLLTRFQHPFSRWLLETIVFLALGRPPLMRPWHPRWVDHTLVMEQLGRVIHDSQQRLLMIADRPTAFTVSFAGDDERAFRLLRTPFLESRQEIYEPLVGSFDLCLMELTEGELAQGDELIDRVVPLMKPDGQILVVVYNKRGENAVGFTASIGFHATRLLRPGATLGGVRVVPASRFRWQVSHAITSLALTAYHRPWVGLPLLAVSGGFLAACSLLANAAARGRSVGTLRSNRLATSFHMVVNVDTGGQDAYRYAARPIVRQSLRRRLGLGDGPVRMSVLARRPDTTPILHGAPRLGAEQASVGGSDGGADGRSSTSIAITGDIPAKKDTTREPQYERCVDLKDQVGLTPLGLMTNQVWYDDPRRLGILLSRYKFVAKMLSGRRDVGEVGCGDAFGARVVLQEVDKVAVYDFDPVFIADIRQRFSERWPITAHLHDIIASPLPQQHDGLYSLDVLEHIPREDEHAYLANLRGALTDDGVLIIGSPSLESQSYASLQSKAGHVNCKSGAEMKALLGNYFTNVFLFSMNDEVVHTGFYPMAHYLLAVCCGKK